MNTTVRHHKTQSDRINLGSLATSMSVINALLQHFDYRLVITKQEAAAYLGYSEHTVQKILEKGDTPLNEIFHKAGKSWVCDVRGLAEFIESDKHKHLDSSPLNMNGDPRVPKRTQSPRTFIQ